MRSVMNDKPFADNPGLQRASTVRSQVMANVSRPLDMINFLANEDFIIDVEYFNAFVHGPA